MNFIMVSTTLIAANMPIFSWAMMAELNGETTIPDITVTAANWNAYSAAVSLPSGMVILELTYQTPAVSASSRTISEKPIIMLRDMEKTFFICSWLPSPSS